MLMFHIKNNAIIKVEDVAPSESCVTAAYEPEDLGVIQVVYNQGNSSVEIELRPIEEVGQTKKIASKGEEYVMLVNEENEQDYSLSGYTITEFVFRELDRIELSFGKKITSLDASNLPVYGSTATSDRVIPLEQTRYNGLIAAA